MENVYNEFLAYVEGAADDFRRDLEAAGGLGAYDCAEEAAHEYADSSRYVIYSFWGAEMISNFPSSMIDAAQDALWSMGESFECIRTHLCHLAYWVTFNALSEAFTDVVEDYEARSEVAANS
jgi:hypothetical protein